MAPAANADQPGTSAFSVKNDSTQAENLAVAYSRSIGQEPDMLDRLSHYDSESQDITELRTMPTARSSCGSGMRHSPSIKPDQPGRDIDLSEGTSRRTALSPSYHSGELRSSARASSLVEEVQSPAEADHQGVPAELGSLTAEVIFVFVCSAGLLLFSFLLGDITVNQEVFKRALGMQNSQLPWLLGAYTTPLSLSVVISGSLSDLMPPRMLMVGAFAWLTIWNIAGAFSIKPSTAILFYIVRAMQGMSIGVLVSGSMSILGRVYKPGLRKSKVFSAMSATAPFGFWLGAIQGGALKAHLPWIFGSNALLSGLCLAAGYMTIPPLQPVADCEGAQTPTIRQFDYPGAALAMSGCVCVLFGLTQGSVAAWSPYTYSLVIIGLLLLIVFFFVERWVKRPLIPNSLWKTKGFTPLMVAHFIAFGAFSGAWQFYAVQFWLRIQQKTPLTVALYLLPNAVVGVLATWVVSKTLHLIPGHFLYLVAMLAFALGPVFFLPQDSNSLYWALSFPGVALGTFGPDLSFAAVSIYITSNVPRSYQGSAGSLLVTVQNLSSAVITSVADAIGTKVDEGTSGGIGLTGLRAIWWFGLAAEVVAGLITICWVRIPKEEEKEHVI